MYYIHYTIICIGDFFSKISFTLYADKKLGFHDLATGNVSKFKVDVIFSTFLKFNILLGKMIGRLEVNREISSQIDGKSVQILKY